MTARTGITCGRCGNPTKAHGNKAEDSPPGCGWTQAMVLNHYGRYGPAGVSPKYGKMKP